MPAPTVTGFTPASVRAGVTVTVTGTDLASFATSVTVAGDGVSSTVLSSTALTFVASAHGGTIRVTTPSGSGDSATPLVVEPWVQLLASADNVSESRAVNLSGGQWRFTGCALTDSLALVGYTGGLGSGLPGRVRAVNVGAGALSLSSAVTFDATGVPRTCRLARLDDTHALLVWLTDDVVAGYNGFRVAVVTCTGGTPTVSPAVNLAVTGVGYPIAVLDASTAMVSANAMVHVSGGAVASVDDLHLNFSPFGGVNLGNTVSDLVGLSATRFLAVYDYHPTGPPFARFTVVDVTGGVVTASPATSVAAPSASGGLFSGAAARRGWRRSDGTVMVPWNSSYRLYEVDPNGMSGPIVAALSDPSSGLPTVGIAVGDLTDDPTLLVAPVGGSFYVPQAGAILETLTGGVLSAKPPQLGLSGVEIWTAGASGASGEILRFAGRVLLLATDSSTHYGLLRLLAPDLPVTVSFLPLRHVQRDDVLRHVQVSSKQRSLRHGGNTYL